MAFGNYSDDIFNRLKHLFGGKKDAPEPPPGIDEKAGQEWYEHKSRLMEEILGKEHDMVMHAIIPYAIGGGLDLYPYSDLDRDPVV